MSVTDHIKKFFTKRAAEIDRESRLSLAIPDEGDSPETIQVASQAAPRTVAPPAPPKRVEAKPTAPVSPDMVMLPLLGARSIAQHQRLLGSVLGGSLLVLVGATAFVLQQADKSAQ